MLVCRLALVVEELDMSSSKQTEGHIYRKFVVDMQDKKVFEFVVPTFYKGKKFNFIFYGYIEIFQ